MPAVISYKFRIHDAEQFKEALDEPANNIIYFYLGGSAEFPDEANPPSPGTSLANTEYQPWRDMIAAKRIFAGDASHVVKRHNWSSGTVYTQFDDRTTNLLTDVFYVVTDEYNVYKCLFNNNGGPSTNKPTGTSTDVETYGDSYKWKYMYTISTSEALKFLTASHIPVKTLTSDDGSNQWDVQQAAKNGAIEVIKITSGGTGYTSAPSVQIVGDGTGATATATISGGIVTGIAVGNTGLGYTYATVNFSGGSPSSPATATPIIGPIGGHGSNPIEELGGIYILLNARLDGSESSTFTVNNDFRKIGLIRDPYAYGTTNRSVEALARQTYRYTLTGLTPNPAVAFAVDQTVSTANGSATVVDYNSGTGQLFTTLPLPRLFEIGEVITSPTGSGTVSAISTPTLQPYSGDVIYMENRTAIERSADQVEDIKLIVEF